MKSPVPSFSPQLQSPFQNAVDLKSHQCAWLLLQNGKWLNSLWMLSLNSVTAKSRDLLSEDRSLEGTSGSCC